MTPLRKRMTENMQLHGLSKGTQKVYPSNELPVVCVDDGPLYDVEYAPSVLLDDAPPGLVCDSGAYHDPNTPVDLEQNCNDPFDNVASTAFACLVPSNYPIYLPLVTSSP